MISFDQKKRLEKSRNQKYPTRNLSWISTTLNDSSNYKINDHVDYDKNHIVIKIIELMTTFTCTIENINSIIININQSEIKEMINADIVDGHTLLHVAMVHQLPVSIFIHLISLGCDIHETNYTGETALKFLYMYPNTDILHLYMQHYFDITLLDITSSTVIQEFFILLPLHHEKDHVSIQFYETLFLYFKTTFSHQNIFSMTIEDIVTVQYSETSDVFILMKKIKNENPFHPIL